MSKEYVLKILTTESEPINKYYRYIDHNYNKLGLETMTFIDFDYPILRISDTEDKIRMFIGGLVLDGFSVVKEEIKER